VVLLLLTTGCDCPAPPEVQPVDPSTGEDPSNRPNSLLPPPREPGPPRPETPAQVARARKEATALVQAMAQGGITGREVTSMADIRGYRLFRRREFRQALAWFEVAVHSDATFEPAMFNAARAAAALGQVQTAHRYLQLLRGLGTPLARTRLALARTDPDLAPLLRE